MTNLTTFPPNISVLYGSIFPVCSFLAFSKTSLLSDSWPLSFSVFLAHLQLECLFPPYFFLCFLASSLDWQLNDTDLFYIQDTHISLYKLFLHNNWLQHLCFHASNINTCCLTSAIGWIWSDTLYDYATCKIIIGPNAKNII